MGSAVAGIVDAKGGLRTVVTQRWRMHHHVGKGERLFVVPGLTVKEPVPWEEVPALIVRVKQHVQRTLAPTNLCGTCTACCFTLGVKDPDLNKPPLEECPNCSVGFGCLIFHRRPGACRRFECLWLRSQARNDRMPPELRPDLCGVIFTHDEDDPLVFHIHTAEPDLGPAVTAFIGSMLAAGYVGKTP